MYRLLRYFNNTLTVHSVSTQSRYMSREKTANLNLRLNPRVKELASKAAAADQRSLTSLIEKLLVDYLRARGYMPKDAE